MLIDILLILLLLIVLPLLREPSAAPSRTPAFQDSQGEDTSEPAQERPVIVRRALDLAWKQGHRTYPALIESVREQTGIGCSRRTVSDWKKLRGLGGDPQQREVV